MWVYIAKVDAAKHRDLGLGKIGAPIVGRCSYFGKWPTARGDQNVGTL
jgi:hypothetical protein